MQKSAFAKKLSSVLMALALVMNSQATVFAEDDSPEEASEFGWRMEEIDGDSISFNRSGHTPGTEINRDYGIEDSEVVRVSIILDKDSTIASGFDVNGISDNAQAEAYRQELQADQQAVVQEIEQNVDGVDQLDVVWNLTLAANLISANVEFGKIGQIAQLPGVSDVVIETKYDVPVTEVHDTDPMMSTSDTMIGSTAAWAEGYTGAGSKVAVIDTGIDTDHQSFDAGAFEYSLSQYDETFDLLDQEDIAAVIDQLNAKINYRTDLTADGVYLSSKIPFAFNYVDDPDYYNVVDHDHDPSGEHGSHVEGIAAANKYIPDGNGGYVNALENVYVQGVAPDAQLLVMKVFGGYGETDPNNATGAYDSDYMAAIEDAIILGADSINLSLGSSSAGFSHEINYIYEEIMDSLTEHGAVVSISMGNNGAFADNAWLYTQMYSDDVSYMTGGSPGSYTNSFTVASVDNTGFTGMYITVDGNSFFYTETEGYGNDRFMTLAGDQSYIAIDGIGTEEQFGALKDVLAGKIAVCYRGQSSFYEKVNAAAANGAAGVIIVNNQAGTIAMNLTGIETTIPAVSLTQADGAMLFASGEQKTAGGQTYYEGVLTVSDSVMVDDSNLDTDLYTMSDFSSWGVPGSLQLKPEITAPGGNIYSVNGAQAGGQGYENMSGTSMAAPQIAGMAAVLGQYIRETGLDKKTGQSPRVLIQSLLMATAEPMYEDWYEDYGAGYYYSVLKQGAGLANVADAIAAKAYILMDEGSTTGASDGKVKAEVGADENGRYTYSFTVNNMTDEELHYRLVSDFFTQYAYPYGETVFALTDTDYLTPEVTYTVDGNEADSLTLAPNGSTKVTVAVDASADAAALSENYPNGFYVEGYTYVATTDYDETDYTPADVLYSIPVLGFCGNWSDASMYDRGSFIDSLYNGIYYNRDDEEVPYSYDIFTQYFKGNYYCNSLTIDDGHDEVVEYDDEGNLVPDPDDDDYLYMINPYVVEETGIPYGREAINSKKRIESGMPRTIRNASMLATFAKNEAGEIIWVSEPYLNKPAVFYSANNGFWVDINAEGYLDFWFESDIRKTAEELGLNEDDVFTIGTVAVPEYYTINTPDSELTSKYLTDLMNSGVLGEGAYLTQQFKVDDTKPEIEEAVFDTDENGNEVLKLYVSDNNFVAYTTILDRNGNEVVDGVVPQLEEETGRYTVVFDLSTFEMPEVAILFAGDYAGNESYYAFYPSMELTAKVSEGSGTITGIGEWLDHAEEIAENDWAVPNLLRTTFEVKPDEGYDLEKLIKSTYKFNPDYSVNEESVESSDITDDLIDGMVDVKIENNTMLEAAFKIKQFNIETVATPAECGTITVDQESPVDYNTPVTFTVTPVEHYEVGTVTLNGEEVELDENGTYTVNAVEDLRFEVSFVQIMGNVTLEYNEGGTVTTEMKEPAEYAEGEIFTFTAVPDEHYILKSITVNDEEIELTEDGNYSIEVVSPVTAIKVTFEHIQHKVTIDAGEHGKVAENGSSVSGEMLRNEAETITLKVVPDEGYEIDKVLVNGTEVTVAEDGTITFTVEGETSVSVVYKAIIYQIEAVSNEGGSVTVSADEAAYGESVTVTVEPELGYVIDTVAVNGQTRTVNVNNELTLTVTGDMDIKAVFKLADYVYTEGMNSNFDRNNRSDLRFKVTGPFPIFTKVYVDDVEISKDNYIAVEGSTVIILKDEYLATLSVGTHTLTTEYSTGQKVVTQFTVSETKKAEPAPSSGKTSPDTSDTSARDGFNWAWVMGGFLTLAAIVFITRLRHSAE